MFSPPFVCLFVCQQSSVNSYRRIFTKFSGIGPKWAKDQSNRFWRQIQVTMDLLQHFKDLTSIEVNGGA